MSVVTNINGHLCLMTAYIGTTLVICIIKKIIIKETVDDLQRLNEYLKKKPKFIIFKLLMA